MADTLELLMSSLVWCHSRLSGHLRRLAGARILLRKDSGQAGVTNKVIILMYFLVRWHGRGGLLKLFREEVDKEWERLKKESREAVHDKP